MKAIEISEFGGPEVLKYKEVAEPSPNKNEVRVRLFAAGVNPNEAYIRTGTYSFFIPNLPYIPGFDGAGVVDEIGEDVNNIMVGDRVFVAALLANRNTGTYAQKVVCDASVVHKLPDSISYEEGASLGIPALTAYRALFHRAKIKPGKTVLIHGASGGVGSLAVQMAKGIGAIVIGTASSDDGKKFIVTSGADYAIDHVNENNKEEIMSITKNKGPDVIIEFLANINLETDLKIVAQYGRIVVVGNRGNIEINPRLAMIKEADILGLALWNVRPKEYNESLYAVEALLKSGLLKPKMGDVFNLENAKLAHEQIMSKKSPGKIVLSID